VPRSKKRVEHVKRSTVVAGRRTSASLEGGFWTGLKEAAAAHNVTIKDMINEVARLERGNLSSALRLFVLDFYREQVQQQAKRERAR